MTEQRLEKLKRIYELKAQGKSQSKIAAELGISRQAVSQQLHREALLIRQARYRANLKQKPVESLENV